jgi:hypothetical protein
MYGIKIVTICNHFVDVTVVTEVPTPDETPTPVEVPLVDVQAQE